MDKTITDPLPRLVYLTSLGLQAHADEVLKPYDLTLEQFHPVKILFLEGGVLGQRPLAELTAKSPANLTRILDRLTRKGFIERRPDPDDRRAVLVSLTPAGAQLVNEVMELFASYLEKIMAGISDDEEAVCRQVLARINRNLAQLSPRALCPGRDRKGGDRC